MFIANNNKIVEVGDRANKTVGSLFRNSMYMPNIKVIKKPSFLTPDAKKVFNYL